MRVRDLERVYEYGYWANQKLFAVLAQLSPEEFTEPVAGSYGSIRNTLVHVLSAEWGWMDRCGGPPRGARLKPDDFPTAESVREVWYRIEVEMRGFLSGLADADLEQTVEFAFGDGPTHTVPRGDLLLHAAIHGVHHRGQVALLLRMLGHIPGDFDVLYFAQSRQNA